SDGLIIYPTNNEAIETTLAMGCWSEKLTTGQDKAAITAGLTSGEGQQFDVYLAGKKQGTVNWPLMGLHNIHNALSAIAAARHIGVTMTQSCDSLSAFRSVKRRMEIIGKVGGVTLYDDFAHHPTAIATTLSGLRAVVKQQRIVAIVELGSNTMRSGVHHDKLAPALQEADKVIFYQAADLTASLATVIHAIGQHATAYTTVAEIIDAVVIMANQGDHIVIMSNGGFDGIHQKMMTALTTQ
ncbi:MAG TPA: UDP-N-acetylmuramate:L-alanyl-gamma-D-glutamyl-meso-diaminopimelate ligase, partial [Gammaproteobacteria bacterium]|nr:UDP-N-acetylmuramate:L-alanyl-gamma-D-glutamyl-meso-diaminopimelate ligase [Gammaproteobacteria bacterium]